MAAQFGSLDDVLKRTPDGPNLLKSAGPASDAFILSTDDQPLINGPVGSAKTTASVKKALVEAQRLWPWDNGRRTYTLGVYREKYDNLWKSTIASWWKVFPKELGTWVGSSPRSAEHIIDWEDQWGAVRLIAQFAAFGDAADPEDMRGKEITDGWLNERDLLPEELAIAISARLARAPSRKILRRAGRLWGDCNAPDVTNYVYRDWFEDPKPGCALYRQPGGLDRDAENPEGSGREYYEDIIRKNQHRVWYIRRMVHNQPGFTRDSDVVFPGYDDDRHRAARTLPVDPHVPVIVGIDGGLTPAAIYQQEVGGQLRWLAEVALEASGMIALAEKMLALEATPRFHGAEFYTVCDPAMNAGEETEERSDRTRLAKLIGRPVHMARSNDPKARCDDIRKALKNNTDSGAPGFLLDPSCKRCRRGFSQTYAYHRVRGTDERGRILKNPDSHPMDAGGYAAMETGQGHARQRKAARQRERDKRRDEAKRQGRYNPLRRQG